MAPSSPRFLSRLFREELEWNVLRKARLDSNLRPGHCTGMDARGLLWGVVLAGLVADLAIIHHGRLVFVERDWPVIETYDFLKTWRTTRPDEDWVYDDSIEGPNDHGPLFRSLGERRWLVTTIDRKAEGVVVEAADLDAAIDRFFRRIEVDFAAVVGMELADWRHRRRTDHPRYVGQSSPERPPA